MCMIKISQLHSWANWDSSKTEQIKYSFNKHQLCDFNTSLITIKNKHYNVTFNIYKTMRGCSWYSKSRDDYPS